MTGCVYRLYILCTFLSGVSTSWIYHSVSRKWKDAAKSCESDNQTLINNINDNLLKRLYSCLNGDEIEFWTGGYTGYGLTDWIAFKGCFYDSGHNINLHGKSQRHSVASCYHSCVHGGIAKFGITTNSCVCLQNDTFIKNSQLRSTHDCIRSGEEYKGMNGSLAVYEYFANPNGTLNSWCSIFKCSDSRYYIKNCNELSYYKCDNGLESSKTLTWDQAVRACFKNGSYLQGTFPNGCTSSSHTEYWSYVTRFREHKYVALDTLWNDYIFGCDKVYIRKGNVTLQQTPECQSILLPYVCQSDDKNNNIYIDYHLNQCKAQGKAQLVSISSSIGPQKTRSSSTGNGDPNGSTITTYLETSTTPGGANRSTSNTQIQFASKVGLIAGVSAASVVAIVVSVVLVVVCRKAFRKKDDNTKNKRVPTSNPGYQAWLYAQTSSNHDAKREVTVDETSIGEVELYDVSREGEYDHLRSNRRIKIEADSMYDTTAQVKAEAEMYSSTRKGNSDVEGSEFYDSMQRIKTDAEGIYDHSITDPTYSKTTAQLYSTAEY